MRRLFTLLLIVCAWTCIPQKVAAEKITIKLLPPSSWTSNFSAYVYYEKDGNIIKPLGEWNDTYNNMKAITVNGNIQATVDVDIEDFSDARVIFRCSDSQRFPADKQPGIKIEKVNGLNTYCFNEQGATDTEFEMVAKVDGVDKELVLPLSQARVRDADNYSTDAFSVGFKDELLPGANGSTVKVYVRGKNNKTLEFRPSDESLGENWVKSNHKYSSMTDYRNVAYTTTGTNTINILKGSGVSYSIGLYIGTVERPWASGTASRSYEVKAKSLSLFKNVSVDNVYRNMYGTSYKNQEGVTRKENLEDFYLVGQLDGQKWRPSKDNGDNLNNIDLTSTEWKERKMEKQVFLNPNNKNVVDSVVYSKVVKKVGSSFGKLYLSFAPASLFPVSDGRSWDTSTIYGDVQKYNFTIRPQLQDQFDGTATKGSVFISGYDAVQGEQRCNGSQALNPLVNDDDYEYYIVRLNVTTSTYRLEFINKEPVIIKSYGIRTFVSRFNYSMDDENEVAAYAVQSFTSKKDGAKLDGQPDGILKLRRLKFIPANEPVVLIYNSIYKKYCDNPSASNESKEIKLTELTGGAGDPKGYLELETQEDWWMKDYSKDEDNDYNNLLVGALDDEVIENGKYHMVGNKYHYDYRHFALNLFSKTKYYKDNKLTSGNYIGFFRASGKVPAGNAYLRLTDKDLDFDGQILGDIDSGLDLKPSETAPSKFSFAFDIEPWDDVTAIQEVKTETKQDDAYYSLQGVKVAHPTKGIYIHNGKKMILK